MRFILLFLFSLLLVAPFISGEIFGYGITPTTTSTGNGTTTNNYYINQTNNITNNITTYVNATVNETQFTNNNPITINVTWLTNTLGNLYCL